MFEDAEALLAGGRIAGADEAGRGCLAGPVYAAFVLGSPELHLSGARDSKTLSPAARLRTEEGVRRYARAFSIACASPEEIGALNIRRATELAVRRAYDLLLLQCDGVPPDVCYVDGNHAPELPGALPQTCVRGDSRLLTVAAASVLAKTARDRYMEAAAEAYPAYGWAKNKGYGVAEHMAALRQYGKTPLHRPGFTMPDGPEQTEQQEKHDKEACVL